MNLKKKYSGIYRYCSVKGLLFIKNLVYLQENKNEMKEIPIRPSNYGITGLTKDEELCVIQSIVFIHALSRLDCFKLFILPTLNNTTVRGTLKAPPTKTTVMTMSKKFFERPEVVKFHDAYKQTYLAYQQGIEEVVIVDKKLREDAVRERIFNGVELGLDKGDLNPDDLTKITTIADKIGLFDGNQMEIKPPIRYLPVPCSECDYAAKIMVLLKDGDAEDLCLRCKYKIKCNEDGISYDKTEQLIKKEQWDDNAKK